MDQPRLPAKSTYPVEDVARIIGRAAALADGNFALQATGERLSYRQLGEIATELGISGVALQRAVSEDRQLLRHARRRVRRKIRLVRHALTWGSASVAIIAIDIGAGGSSFYFIPVAGWGVGVAVHAVLYLTGRGSNIEVRMLAKEYADGGMPRA